MSNLQEVILRTERILAEFEVLQKSVQRVQFELRVQGVALREKLLELRTQSRRSRRRTQTDFKIPGDGPEGAPPANAEPFRERRAHPRRKGKPISVQVSSAELEEPLSAWVIDRSVGGLCLLVDEALEVGVLVRVRPINAPAEFAGKEMIVRNKRPTRSSWYLGCAFVQEATAEELQMFCAEGKP